MPSVGFANLGGATLQFCEGCTQALDSALKVLAFNRAHQDMVKQQCPACLKKTVGASGFCDECLEVIERDLA